MTSRIADKEDSAGVGQILLARFRPLLSRQAGFQVHRSSWVSELAITSCESITMKILRLDGGVSIPISRTYRLAISKYLPS